MSELTRTVPGPASRGAHPTTTGAQPHAPASLHTVRRSRLPGSAHASSGLRPAETAVFVGVVPLLTVPLLVATMGAFWAVAGGLALTAVVAWACLARQVVIGNGWVADRRLVSYRVTHGAHLRAVELVENGHGGVLRLQPHAGRAHRLRRAEFDTPAARAALGTVVGAGAPQLGVGVRATLEPASPALAR